MKTSLRTLKEFKSVFQTSKANLPTYFKEDEQPKTWDFQEKLVFARFDSFNDRLKTIHEFCTTANQFLKLEKVVL